MRNPSPEQVIPPTPTVPNIPKTGDVVYPVAANFATWFNQSTATLVDHTEAIVLTKPSHGGTAQCSAVAQLTPAAPWVLESKVIAAPPFIKNFMWSGIMVGDTATGSMITMSNGYNNLIRIASWTNGTTYGATLSETTGTTIGWWEWWKIEDDGVDLIFSVSREGLEWLEIYSQARTTFLANPDSVGPAVQPTNQGSPTYKAWATVQSWNLA